MRNFENQNNYQEIHLCVYKILLVSHSRNMSIALRCLQKFKHFQSSAYLELSSKDSTKASYRVDQLISGEVMNDDCGVQKQRESENICEIIEHLNVKCSVYSDDLVNDRFLVYCEDEERSVLKVMDVDFKKVICQDDVADQISGIFCFGLSSVYFTSTKQVYLRQMVSL